VLLALTGGLGLGCSNSWLALVKAIPTKDHGHQMDPHLASLVLQLDMVRCLDLLEALRRGVLSLKVPGLPLKMVLPCMG